MSGDTDDGDRGFDDRDHTDRDPRADQAAIREAKRAVSIPAIGLIVIGVLTLISAVGGLIQLQTIGPAMNDAIAEIEADPNIPAAEKKEQVKLLTKIRDLILDYGLPLYLVSLAAGVVILVGGIRFRSLANPGLVFVSSLTAALPISGCCVLGLVFGIWAIVVLWNPVVKAGYAARRRAQWARTEPDEY